MSALHLHLMLRQAQHEGFEQPFTLSLPGFAKAMPGLGGNHLPAVAESVGGSKGDCARLQP